MTGTKKNAPIIRIIILALLVISILVIWKKYPPSKVANSVTTKMEALPKTSFSSLSDSMNSRLKVKMSGYWERTAPAQLPDRPYRITDRIELKTNGIFWQVNILTLYLPGGDSATTTHIQTGYLNPFKFVDGDSTTILIDALIRSQIFAGSQDTCYIPSLASALQNQSKLLGMSSEVFAKTLRRSNDSLFIDNRVYGMYDTTGPRLAEFFPLGATGLIDKINLRECGANASFGEFTIVSLRQTFTSKKHSGSSDTAAVRQVLSQYYAPLVVAELARHFTTGILEPIHGKVVFTITVGPDGKVTDVNKNKSDIGNSDFVQLLTASIKGWYFMPVDSAEKQRIVKYTFIL